MRLVLTSDEDALRSWWSSTGAEDGRDVWGFLIGDDINKIVWSSWDSVSVYAVSPCDERECRALLLLLAPEVEAA